MLMDLGRNDIGRVAETGSVSVTDKMVIERYSHVMHIVSSVEGQLVDGMSNLDVLRATFPGGDPVRCAQGPGNGNHRRIRTGKRGV